MKRAAKLTANDAKRRLSSSSPVGSGRRHYAKGWTAKETDNDSMTIGYTVYNKQKPGLAHLLEHGHGGPHAAGAIVHIKPVEEQAKEKFETELTKALKKG